MSASTYRYLPIVVHSHSLTGTSDQSKRMSVHCRSRLLVPTKRTSVLCILTGSSQCLSVAASGYWYIPSGHQSFAFWPVQVNICQLPLLVTGTYQADVCPSLSDRFKPTSVCCHFRLLVPTKRTSVLHLLTGSSQMSVLRRLPVTGTHQADICPLPSDQFKPMSVHHHFRLLVPTKPTSVLAFQLVQANVCPLPSNCPKPMSVHHRYLPTGTFQPVPSNWYLSNRYISDRYSSTGTLQLVPSNRYFPTGTFQLVYFPPFFSVLSKSHPGTFYCWYPSIQSILHLWCNSCQINSCTDHHIPINQALVLQPNSCPTTKPWSFQSLKGGQHSITSLMLSLDTVMGHHWRLPLSTMDLLTYMAWLISTMMI